MPGQVVSAWVTLNGTSSSDITNSGVRDPNTAGSTAFSAGAYSSMLMVIPGWTWTNTGSQSSTLNESVGQTVQSMPDLATGAAVAVTALVFDPDIIVIRHVVKLMNNILSNIRRERDHNLTDKLHRYSWKGMRSLLMMNPENPKQNEKVDEQAQLNESLKLNESLSVAYYLKEDLRQFWNQRSQPAAEKFLEA